MKKLLFLSGSSHVGSANWRLANAAAAITRQSFGDRIETVSLDLMEFDLPNFESASNRDPLPEAVRLKAMFGGVSGVFMSSDEYTGAYSAIFKNAIGWLRLSDANLRTPFDGMQVALCTTAGRGAGGLRGQPALQQLLQELGAIVIPQRLEMGTMESPFDREGQLSPKAQRQLLNGCVGALCAKVLAGRAA